MDALNLHRTEIECPVAGCPWTYNLTTPRTVGDARGDGPLQVVIPPPAGEHLRPAERAAGIHAARPRMAAPSLLCSFDDVVEAVASAARDQDDAVALEHLSGHTAAELTEALGARAAGLVLEHIARRLDPHPPVTIPMPGGPRLVAHWQDEVPAGYECRVCRTVETDPDVMAGHFRDRHLVVSQGVRGLHL